MDYVFSWSLCSCLQFTIPAIAAIAGKFHLTSVYVGYAHSHSQAVILQVLCVGGGVVGERGVGDELMATTKRGSIHALIMSNTNIVIA